MVKHRNLFRVHQLMHLDTYIVYLQSSITSCLNLHISPHEKKIELGKLRTALLSSFDCLKLLQPYKYRESELFHSLICNCLYLQIAAMFLNIDVTVPHLHIAYGKKQYLKVTIVSGYLI